jgi:nicotinate-nucleotide adenylyltransferase
LKLGILGGTFDPIHNGHLAAARAALDCAGLDRVLFMPSAEPPHRGPARASAEQRLAMCRLAVEGEPRFETSDIEIRRGGVSYTLDSLRELSRTRPEDRLHLILGWDAARLFATWHEPAQVQEQALMVVVSRPGAAEPEEALLRSAGLDPARVIMCLRSTPDISSSELRAALAADQSIAGQAPDAVARYIAAHDLYRDNR